mmetsp:Transcript_15408/g.31151  ORF Transcript_15408/g.31151 Transcript_15408/m.31151 type:complete len:214 (-) Transcript_15408:2319-2960(-)
MKDTRIKISSLNKKEASSPPRPPHRHQTAESKQNGQDARKNRPNREPRRGPPIGCFGPTGGRRQGTEEDVHRLPYQLSRSGEWQRSGTERSGRGRQRKGVGQAGGTRRTVPGRHSHDQRICGEKELKREQPIMDNPRSNPDGLAILSIAILIFRSRAGEDKAGFRAGGEEKKIHIGPVLKRRVGARWRPGIFPKHNCNGVALLTHLPSLSHPL